jgi:hypothetical protein
MVTQYERASREADVERAMREVARVQDPVVAGLITGLVKMQQEILLRLRALERRVDASPGGASGGASRRSKPRG